MGRAIFFFYTSSFILNLQVYSNSKSYIRKYLQVFEKNDQENSLWNMSIIDGEIFQNRLADVQGPSIVHHRNSYKCIPTSDMVMSIIMWN